MQKLPLEAPWLRAPLDNNHVYESPFALPPAPPVGALQPPPPPLALPPITAAVSWPRATPEATPPPSPPPSTATESSERKLSERCAFAHAHKKALSVRRSLDDLLALHKSMPFAVLREYNARLLRPQLRLLHTGANDATLIFILARIFRSHLISAPFLSSAATSILCYIANANAQRARK